MEEKEITFREDVKAAVDCMKRGGIILYPTDTIWGIGCDATNPEAVKKIYELKKRADSKSMLVLVANEAMLERTVDEIPEVAWQLIETSEEPLTIIYDHPKGVASELLAEDGSLGVRITKEKYSSELCRLLRRPVVSTSANISGNPPAPCFKDISPEIVNGMDYVALYRRDECSLPSPSHIIKLSEGGVVKVIR